ncbi:hypothetical protein MKW98_007297 [Papaver atlanticum]|uniref:Peptidase S26 domain-containing protein n=1 Tax=Papaver atlanticum TaxID=357466 RepID=A0AAD4SAY9_9MAGN|nr:hypothetical protein MKW98_007297 [Papaver atlanticum]
MGFVSKDTVSKRVKHLIKLFGKFLCFLHVTDTYICSPALGYGPSMLPTLSLTGDLVLWEKISPRFGKVNKGDIVSVRPPENPKESLTKRILGMEGDNVTYLVDPQNSEECRTITVPKGHIWIQGDNIYNSYDSRQFGPVPYCLIQSKVFCRIWPISSFGSLGQKVQ